NAQVDQPDCTQPGIRTSLIDAKDGLDFERYRAPKQRVRDAEPRATLIHLAGYLVNLADRASLDLNKAIAGCDACSRSRSVSINPVGNDAAAAFHPRDAIERNHELCGFAK